MVLVHFLGRLRHLNRIYSGLSIHLRELVVAGLWLASLKSLLGLFTPDPVKLQ